MVSIVIRFVRVVVVLAAASAMGFWLYSIRETPDRQQVQQLPPGVHLIEAHPETQQMVVEAFGTVAPRNSVKVTAEVAGRLERMDPAFREGGKIEKDQVIIEIDRRAAILDRAAAKARVARAEAEIDYLTRDIENLSSDLTLSESNMDLVSKEMERLKALNQREFASKTSLDKAQQQYLAARIQVQAIRNRIALTDPLMAQQQAALTLARNDVEKMDLLLEKSRILAPFEGFVQSRLVEKGDYVNPGQILGSVYRVGALDVDVRIPLAELRWIQPQFDRGQLPEARVTMANAAPRDARDWPARVARIKAEIDDQTRTLGMTLEILPDPGPDSGNPLKILKPGAFVQCRIEGKRYDDVYVLPRHLVHTGNRVYVVKNGRLEIRQVSVLRKFNDQVFVESGLMPGDHIVSSPLPGAFDGMAVTVKPADRQENTP
ncbi:MAG: efflux RND transporter periplasmic adaptor subunit [Desulfotignum sp.]|nr:efflux RND transporter periplasmic adaptor subunit [Desulfotignum sp.]